MTITPIVIPAGLWPRPHTRYEVDTNESTPARHNARTPETQFVAGVHGNDFVLTITRATAALTNQIAGTLRFL